METHDRWGQRHVGEAPGGVRIVEGGSARFSSLPPSDRRGGFSILHSTLLCLSRQNVMACFCLFILCNSLNKRNILYYWLRDVLLIVVNLGKVGIINYLLLLQVVLKDLPVDPHVIDT